MTRTTTTSRLRLMFNYAKRSAFCAIICAACAFAHLGPARAQQLAELERVELSAAEVTGLPADTLAVLSLKEVYEWTLSNHPLVLRADLLPEAARRELQQARGAFDPAFEAAFLQKDLLNYKEEWRPSTYYDHHNYAIKAPLWIGEVKGGFDRARGINVNPEAFTPPQGLAYLQFKVPIGRGLLWDERRAVLRQAELLEEINEAERVKLVNKLLLQVAKDYWNWAQAYQKLAIYLRGLRLAEIRAEAVEQSIEAGDNAAIYGVEADREVHLRLIETRDARIQYENARLILSNHLWSADGAAVEIRENVLPDTLLPGLDPNLAPATRDSLRFFAQNRHPEINKLRFKLAQYDIEEQYRRQNLLPKVDLSYKPLFIPVTNDKKYAIDPNYFDANYLRNNYVFGVELYMPLFLRKERGKLQAVRIKQLQNRQELQFARREILNNVTASYNQTEAFAGMIEAQDQAAEFSQQLVDAEYVKFDNGESSLFLINYRERSLIKDLDKLIELRVKYQKSRAELYWAAGARIEMLWQ